MHNGADLALPNMSILLQLCAYASRAKALFGYQLWKAKRHRSRFYEDVWREAATELDATFQVLAKGSFRISRDGASTRMRNNCTTLDDRASYRIALDKPLVHTMLRSHGLPTPNHAVFSLNNLNEAYDFLTHQRLCVVKPAIGTGAGKGVTTGIETRRQLLKAAVRASGYGSQLLVEEQVKGDNIRLLYLDGQLLDAVRRCPPTTVGDGKSSISQLVRRLNQRRLDTGYTLAPVILKYDLDMQRTLERQNLSWRSVPADGQRVVLKTVINDNVADDNERVVDQVSESIIEAGSSVAEVIGVRLVGVDIITPDIRQRLEDVGGTILEVNTGPGYHYHYFTRGEARRVAVPILRACLEDAGSRENPKAKQR
jgi:D-alanine-D-alanine ligase-like ATP-grasp enzyme